jgi:hypothetical protein
MRFLFSIFLLLNAGVCISQEQAAGAIQIIFDYAEMDVNKEDTVIISYINRENKIVLSDTLYLKPGDLIPRKKLEIGNYDVNLIRGKSFNRTIEHVFVFANKITFLDGISLVYVPVEKPRERTKCTFKQEILE